MGVSAFGTHSTRVLGSKISAYFGLRALIYLFFLMFSAWIWGSRLWVFVKTFGSEWTYFASKCVLAYDVLRLLKVRVLTFGPKRARFVLQQIFAYFYSAVFVLFLSNMRVATSFAIWTSLTFLNVSTYNNFCLFRIFIIILPHFYFLVFLSHQKRTFLDF